VASLPAQRATLDPFEIWKFELQSFLLHNRPNSSKVLDMIESRRQLHWRASVTSVVLLTAFFVTAYGQKGSGASAGGSGGKTGAGQSSGSGQSGSAQGSGASPFFETEMLAYGGANEIAYAVSHAICNAGLGSNARVVIFDQVSFQNLQAWQSFKASAAVLESAYGTLLPPPGKDAAASGTDAFGTDTARPASFFAGSDVSNLISALAASTTNTASTFTMPDSTIAIAILHQLPRACPTGRPTVFYYPLKGDSANLKDAQTALKNVFAPVNKARAAVQAAIEANYTNNISKQPDVTKNPDYLVFADLNTQYDQWMATLVTSVAQNQQPGQFVAGPNIGVTSLLQGAEVERDLQTANTYVLYANTVVAGGTQRDRKNIFSLFVGDFITYSGGLVVNFGLVSASTNRVVLADVIRYRTPNTRLHNAHEINSVESTDSDDNLFSLCGKEKKRHYPGGIETSEPCNVLGPTADAAAPTVPAADAPAAAPPAAPAPQPAAPPPQPQ
jgi:hypothetical protein